MQRVASAQRLRTIDQWQQVDALLQRTPGVRAVSPVVSGAGFAARGSASRAVVLRGVVPERFRRVIDLPSKLVAGRYSLRGSEVLVGRELADALGARVGDRLLLTSAEGRQDSFLVTGIFDLGNRDVNERWVLVPLRAGQTLLDRVGGVTSLELTVEELFGAEALAQQLSRRTGLVAESWMTLNAQPAGGAALAEQLALPDPVLRAGGGGAGHRLGAGGVGGAELAGDRHPQGHGHAHAAGDAGVPASRGRWWGWWARWWAARWGAGLALFFASLARNPDGSPTFPVTLRPGLFLAACGGGGGHRAARGAAARAARGAARPRGGHPQWLSRCCELQGVVKEFGTRVVTRVLHGVDLTLQPGEFAALIGPSGSGKSTLLNLIGLLDRPTAGRVLLAGAGHRRGSTTTGSPACARARWASSSSSTTCCRAFSALENVVMPQLADAGLARRPRCASAPGRCSRRWGWASAWTRAPGELSGGQQQRVAIARALAHAPRAGARRRAHRQPRHRAPATGVFELLRHFNRSRGHDLPRGHARPAARGALRPGHRDRGRAARARLSGALSARDRQAGCPCPGSPRAGRWSGPGAP